MYTSNQSLAHIFLQINIPANDLVTYLDILGKLLKTYKKKLFTKEMMASIKTVDEQLFSLLMIINHYNKSSASSLKSISRIIKTQGSGYIPTFTVNSIETPQKNDIIKSLYSKFPGCEVKINRGFDLGVFMYGEGWYYKRNIEQDLDKLL